MRLLRLSVAIVLGSFVFTGVAFAASIGLGTSKLFVWSQTLTKGTCNQTSTTEDDTFVQQQNPSKTNGNAKTLMVGTQPGPMAGAEYGFVRFDLSACGLPITAGADDATLTLVITGMATTDTISLFPVSSSWSSSTLNWNGVGSLTVGTMATGSFTGSLGSHTVTVTADVDSAIKAGTLWGWEIRDTSGTAQTQIAAGNSKTDQPSMTLSYEK